MLKWLLFGIAFANNKIDPYLADVVFPGGFDLPITYAKAKGSKKGIPWVPPIMTKAGGPLAVAATPMTPAGPHLRRNTALPAAEIIRPWGTDYAFPRARGEIGIAYPAAATLVGWGEKNGDLEESVEGSAAPARKLWELPVARPNVYEHSGAYPIAQTNSPLPFNTQYYPLGLPFGRVEYVPKYAHAPPAASAEYVPKYAPPAASAVAAPVPPALHEYNPAQLYHAWPN